MALHKHTTQLVLFKSIPEKRCPTCGKIFRKPLVTSKRAWKKQRFCSLPCSGTLLKPGHQLNKGVKHTPEQVERQRQVAKPRYGSDNPLWRGGPQEIRCHTCDRPFLVKPYRRTNARYCSKQCRTDDPANVSKLHERIRRTSAYKAWRKAVFERDDYTCQWCHTRGGMLNADHIKPFAIYPDLRFVVSNGRTLCNACHRKTDTYGALAWRPKAEGY